MKISVNAFTRPSRLEVSTSDLPRLLSCSTVWEWFYQAKALHGVSLGSYEIFFLWGRMRKVASEKFLYEKMKTEASGKEFG